ncbi:MAG: ATP-binding cassette domain-containing protein [marine benthic group bacterium]|jgi:phospholipid/cholesterol/gamma-HCH transport system ATP-binding protein|nr:ATP-binding cassette domain-containing protein [Gemmatimonadota bacterium]MCL7990175.1 ATP-binding cassette domain-containing protein [Gemmatimonadota bacterium]
MIQLEAVRKSFGSQIVLDGVDLEIATGETVAVLGRSGSGKSVLLKQVARLLRPDGGLVRVGDVEMSGADKSTVMRVRSSMGYVFQFAALFDSLTIGENIALPLRRAGISAEESRTRVIDVLETVGLPDQSDRYPAELSGGMRKRAGIARAVVARPSYLLYDEPTTGLDPVTTAVIDGLMLEMKRDLQATSILVTHDIQSAFRVADRLALLHGGRVRFEGTPDETRSSDDPLVRAFVEGRQELWPPDSV